jgi:hypothetical protein
VKRGRIARDSGLVDVLRAADELTRPADAVLSRLSGRILVAAGPLLDERAAPHRTVWDYAERWSATLLPIGALTAVAAGLCLFALSAHEATSVRAVGDRVALLGAATNRVSSQNLLDFLVSSDPGTNTATTTTARWSGR